MHPHSNLACYKHTSNLTANHCSRGQLLVQKRPENAIFIAPSGLRTTEETSNPTLLFLRTMTRVLSHLMSQRTSPTWLSPCKL